LQNICIQQGGPKPEVVQTWLHKAALVTHKKMSLRTKVWQIGLHLEVVPLLQTFCL